MKRVNFIHKRLGEKKRMSDATSPCVQEHENWPNAAMDIERQRSALEELVVFEREVHNRYWFCKEKDTAKSEVAEKSELCGLEVRSEPPRLLNDTDFRDDDSFANHSRLSRHRQKTVSGSVLPHSLLIARSVSKPEFVGNKKAMEACWKEWNNVEKKDVWRWDTLAEWDDVAGEARKLGGDPL